VKSSENEKASKPQNKFLRVITIAKRARQISEGSRPLLANVSANDPIDAAIREVEAAKILIEIKKPKEFKLIDDIFKTVEEPPEEIKPKAVRTTRVVRSKKAKKKKK
jgi:DNA-directed RNA polymerase subunit K/omega